MSRLNKLFFKYLVYCPVLLIRREWIFGYLSRLKKSQYYSKNELNQIQLNKLNKLLKHARETVPYYKDLPVDELESLEDLKNIPFLEKSELRDSAHQLHSTRVGLRPRPKTTGGSTGAAVTLRKSADGMAQELAATWRGYSWAGIDIGDKQARFWGVPHGKKDKLRARIIDFVSNRKRVSAFAFSELDLKIYNDDLGRFGPKYFYGYVSMIRQFSEYIENNNLTKILKPTAIITTAEVLSESDRAVIERVFGCKVFNEYGCGEVGTIAHECKFGNLHVNSENVIVEIVDDHGDGVAIGEVGEIVVTDLVNYSMPLIRYKIKDFGAFGSDCCECGVGLPIIKEIFGREYDYLVNDIGEKFHGEFFLYIVEELARSGVILDGVQFLQDEKLNIVVNIVSDVNFNYEEFFSQRIKALMGAEINVSVLRVSNITRESSGKLRVVKRLGLKGR